MSFVAIHPGRKRNTPYLFLYFCLLNNKSQESYLQKSPEPIAGKNSVLDISYVWDAFVAHRSGCRSLLHKLIKSWQAVTRPWQMFLYLITKLRLIVALTQCNDFDRDWCHYTGLFCLSAREARAGNAFRRQKQDQFVMNTRCFQFNWSPVTLNRAVILV